MPQNHEIRRLEWSPIKAAQAFPGRCLHNFCLLIKPATLVPSQGALPIHYRSPKAEPSAFEQAALQNPAQATTTSIPDQKDHRHHLREESPASRGRTRRRRDEHAHPHRDPTAPDSSSSKQAQSPDRRGNFLPRSILFGTSATPQHRKATSPG